jgi:acetyl-CoA C-acetyltransferase
MPKKLARRAAIVGAGMSKFGAFKDKSARDLFVEAFNELMQSVDKGAEVKDIEALYLGDGATQIFEGQAHTAPLMADWIGLVPKPATRIESACASGGVALREGLIARASGLYDIVLVGGVE